MLTVEQYIAQMKKKEKIDEFYFKNHAENMAAVMKWVVDYFTTYLNPEEYDYETVKLQQAVAKVEREIANTLPRSKDFVIEYYRKNRTRIDKTLKSHLKSYEYMHLFFNRDDFENVVNEFCDDRKNQDTGVAQHKDELIILAQEIKERGSEKLDRTGYKYFDEGLFSWVKTTYVEYKVNLFDFAGEIAREYYEKYVDSIYDRSLERFYHINRYNHRYNNNPFGIDDIYRENCKRPFIHGRKGELEMLIMYEWIFEWAEDPEYWPEYVNLCIATSRVNIIRNMNMLTLPRFYGHTERVIK